MLIEFTVGNFRSFREPVTLSLEAAAIRSEDPQVDQNNLIKIEGRPTLLTSAAVYGANASGKSNLVSALMFMRKFVLNSVRESLADQPIGVDVFRLSTETENQPAHFELTFLINGQKFRYGFEVTHNNVEREWLHVTPTIREAELFVRTNAGIKVNQRNFKEGRGLEERTRPNALFLSVVAQFNGQIAKEIVGFFRQIRFVSGLSDVEYRASTIKQYQEDPEIHTAIKKLVSSMDLGFEDISFDKKERGSNPIFPDNTSDESKADFLHSTGGLFLKQTSHTKFDAIGQPVGTESFDFETNESQGTQKLFYLAGPVLDALTKGLILVIDEMEARLHPLITRTLIRLFNSLETNPKRAQLIFTTHDTNLLDRSLLRRDQIWFVEKDSRAASHLYSLVEFKPIPRNDESFERNYLRGKYGAVPYLGDLAQILTAAEHSSKESGDGA